MGVTALIATAVLGWQLSIPGAVSYFPGEYFDLTGRQHLTSLVLERWPGPSGLLRLWMSEDLDEKRRVVLLLGGAAHHDATLLPAYAEAAVDESPRVRQAAVYGYRLLTGDPVPDVSQGVDLQSGQKLQHEIWAMASTLRRHTLVQVWLHALLVGKGHGLPGWSGLVLQRPESICLKAVDRVFGPEDLPDLVMAYRLSPVERHRISLLKLIEGITLQRFIVRPRGERATWGLRTYRDGMKRFEGWLDARCDVDSESIVGARVRRVTGQSVRPFTAEACSAWLRMLAHSNSRWWSLVADRLYQCGAPYHQMSILGAEGRGNEDGRELLLSWYRLSR